MSGQVDFWFDFASSYSYLSAMRIDAEAADLGLTVRWRPFLLGPIFAAQGWNSSPFTLYPAKGRYMWRDIERICAARSLPFTRPPDFPENGLKAARIALAAGEAAPAFCRAVFAAEFGEGASISSDDTLATCLAAAGLPATLLEAAADPDMKARLRAQTEEAAALDLFGAPSFLVGDELFWGDDRLDAALALAFAKQG